MALALLTVKVAVFAVLGCAYVVIPFATTLVVILTSIFFGVYLYGVDLLLREFAA